MAPSLYTWLHVPLGLHKRIVFKRLVSFFSAFNVVSALIGGLSLAILTFPEFHPIALTPYDETTTAIASNALLSTSDGLLTSSALSTVVAVMLATMLLFKFQGHERPTRLDLFAAWLPLALLDIAIVELLVGLVLWYASGHDYWRTALICVELGGMVMGSCGIACWMWWTMSVPGGLGIEESDAMLVIDTRGKR